MRNVFATKNHIFNDAIFFFLRNRNRLESNSDHWNALLLSLKEMTEWVIRKDTELTTIERIHSPVRGDAASLAKQLVRERFMTCLMKMFDLWDVFDIEMARAQKNIFAIFSAEFFRQTLSQQPDLLHSAIFTKTSKFQVPLNSIFDVERL